MQDEAINAHEEINVISDPSYSGDNERFGRKDYRIDDKTGMLTFKK